MALIIQRKKSRSDRDSQGDELLILGNVLLSTLILVGAYAVGRECKSKLRRQNATNRRVQRFQTALS